MLSLYKGLRVFALLVLVGAGSMCSRRTTVAQLDELLRTSVPVGTHHSRVTAVLDSMKVEHSGYGEAEREIVAIWRRTSVRLFDESAIQARLYFDSQGNLLRYELKEQITAT
jgi:hypothetical protein